MRRSTDYTKIVIVAIVVVVAIGFIFMKVLSNDSTKDFKNYVAKYQEAIESYSTKDLPESYNKIYTYDELTNILKLNGYLDEFSDSSVVISGDNITLSKENNKVSYYNYNNTQTFENRFELKFTKDGGDYTCTKVECK